MRQACGLKGNSDEQGDNGELGDLGDGCVKGHGVQEQVDTVTRLNLHYAYECSQRGHDNLGQSYYNQIAMPQGDTSSLGKPAVWNMFLQSHMWIAKGSNTKGGVALSPRIRTEESINTLLLPGDHVGKGTAGGASDGHVNSPRPTI